MPQYYYVDEDGTTISGIAFKNKTQGVLIGRVIDPDSPTVNNTHVQVAVMQAA